MLLGVCFSCNSYLDLKPYGETIPKTPEEFSALLHSILNDIDYGTDRRILGISGCGLDSESCESGFGFRIVERPDYHWE